MNPRFVLGAVVLVFFAACGEKPAGPVDTTATVGQSGSDLATAVTESLDGAEIYALQCARCHEGGVARSPHRMFLNFMSPETILTTLNEGVMQQYAEGLSSMQRQRVADHLGAKDTGDVTAAPKACTEDPDWFDYDQPPFARGWGIQDENTRFIPHEVARLTAADVPRLELKWAFAYPRATRARSQPSFAGGAVYVGSQDGTVYALDARTGCVRWTFKTTAEVRTGLTVAPWAAGKEPVSTPTLYFGDLIAGVYAVDATTGDLKWKTRVDDHPNATVTAQPVLHGDRVFVSVSSLEVVPAADPNYACCSFRGSLVALAADSGEQVFKSYTILDEPAEVGRNSAGVPILAPSGAPVWNSPTVDAARGRLYLGTGENYSSPAQGTSDSIIAFDIEDGDMDWVYQATSGDAWNVACMTGVPDKTNCPVEDGPDVDFGAPPILVRDGEQQILVAGQKSGDVYGIDPEDGSVVWHEPIGRGGVQGGVHFGMAAKGRTVYVPMSDFDDDELPVEDARPGLYAVDAFTGERLWGQPADDVCGGLEDCDPGISAAITATEDAVFAGHMDGRLRAYDAGTGEVLWQYDTTRPVQTLNGEIARGGSMGGGSGPMVVNGMVYANSGYGLYFHMPGNVLFVFAAVAGPVVASQ